MRAASSFLPAAASEATLMGSAARLRPGISFVPAALSFLDFVAVQLRESRILLPRPAIDSVLPRVRTARQSFGRACLRGRAYLLAHRKLLVVGQQPTTKDAACASSITGQIIQGGGA